ncbi:MAG TPA: flagellin [Rhizomicrobium sp.]|jgi:flagellar hook-associated protein 3 FlgL|nr:flagellin [Rhizomicrobium sp.]
MSIDRVATSAQSQYMLAQLQQASSALDKTQNQVASGKVSNTYAGIGDKTAVLESARSAAKRADSYQATTQLALNQANLQDTQLSAMSDLAAQLRDTVTKALANNDGSTLMTQAQSIFDQATQILNSKDANGNYIYGGDNDNTPPVKIANLSDLSSLASASDAFANGSLKKKVQVGDGVTVQIGQLASDVGGDLMSALKSIVDYNGGANGPFGTPLTQPQSGFLSTAIQSATTAANTINNAAAANGNVYNQLQAATDQQQTLSTLYKGFVSSLEDVDMGKAITQLNQNQVALQAALKVTSSLSQISLLNYL